MAHEDCRNYEADTATEGFCKLSPPIPVEDYPLIRSQYPRVEATGTQCGQFVPGVISANIHSNCVHYSALDANDPGSCLHDPTHELCADGECLANPPVPVGDFIGDLSAYPRVMAAETACMGCYEEL